MKILRLMDRLNDGGPARQAIALSLGFEEMGCKALLATGDVEPHETGMENLARGQGVHIVKIPGLQRQIRPLQDLRAFFHIWRLVREERPDVVHTHKSKAGVLGRLAARLCGVPAVCHTFHGHVLDGYFSGGVNRLFRWIESVMARLTDRIIVLAPSQKKQLLDLSIGSAAQYCVIPSGVPLAHLEGHERHRGELKEELGLDPDTRLVGIIGRLAPVKNHEDFLAAAEQVAGGRKDVRFIVVGDGERRAALEREAARRGLLPGAVFFLGQRSDLARIYADVDVVTLCSVNEGLPMALVEAMACGKPVVATDVGAVRDLLEDGRAGVIVPPRDPAALAGAILAVLNGTETTALLSRRAREAAHRYRVENLVAKTRALYASLLAGKTSEDYFSDVEADNRVAGATTGASPARKSKMAVMAGRSK